MSAAKSAVKGYLTSPTFIHAVLLFLVLAVVSWVGLKGKETFFPKERGEALEEKFVKIEYEMESNHKILHIEQKHTNEKLDGLIKLNEKMVDMYLNSRNP